MTSYDKQIGTMTAERKNGEKLTMRILQTYETFETQNDIIHIPTVRHVKTTEGKSVDWHPYKEFCNILETGEELRLLSYEIMVDKAWEGE